MGDFSTENIKNLVTETYDGEKLSMPEGINSGTGSPNPPLNGKESFLNSINVISFNNSTENYTINSSRYFNNNVATEFRNPTGSAIVSKFSQNNGVHNIIYTPQDFLFLPDYGKIPNNYLITLRRFPNPCSDNILNKDVAPIPDAARLLTYMDGEDNKLSEIMSFSIGFNYKDFQSEIQTIERSKTGFGNNIPSINKFLGAFDTTGRNVRENLQGEAATNADPYTDHQNNYTWGPIDVIDKIITRDIGLKFEQDITVKFKFAVRSYAGIDQKVVFLDLLGNILNMTSNKAPFWGGAVRFTGGGGFTNGIGDFNKLKSGDLQGFIGSVMTGIKDKITAPFSGGFLEGIKTLAGNIGANMLGGQLDKLGRPEMHSLHSLLSGTPTGEWHLTIGNPFSPIMMIGNLILEDSTIGVEGPLNVDDVPSFITVECKLKHAMPRDKFAVQSMFNQGRGRYYSSQVDFKSKTYYRNRAAGNSLKSNENKTSKIVDKQIQSAETIATDTSLYLKSAYKNF